MLSEKTLSSEYDEVKEALIAANREKDDLVDEVLKLQKENMKLVHDMDTLMADINVSEQENIKELVESKDLLNESSKEIESLMQVYFFAQSIFLNIIIIFIIFILLSIIY